MMLSMSHSVRVFIVINSYFIRKKPLKQNQCIFCVRNSKVVLDSMVVLSAAPTPFQL